MGYQLVSQVRSACALRRSYVPSRPRPLPDPLPVLSGTLATAPPTLSPPPRRPSTAASLTPRHARARGAAQIDYATGFIAAYGAILALLDRQIAAVKGHRWGGEVVYASLCQTATWMALLGAGCPSFASYVSRVTRLLWRSDRHAVEVAGDMTYLPMTAAVQMSITPAKRHGFERWWPDDAPTEDLVPVKK